MMTQLFNNNKIKFFSSKSSNKLPVYDAQINFFSEGESARRPLENFINQVFKKHYNVSIEQFYPDLLAIESVEAKTQYSQKKYSQKNTIKAVAGIRCASDENLFSEYYLAQSLESELSHIYHKDINRQKVVEVGNLAPANVGQMRWLIAAITAFLYSAGYEYLVFTAVPSIYNSFKHMDMPVRIMTEANPDKLPGDIKQHWGAEYYAHKPVVITGDIIRGFEVMKNNIYRKNTKIIPLFEKACRLGEQFLFEKNFSGAVA